MHDAWPMMNENCLGVYVCTRPVWFGYYYYFIIALNENKNGDTLLDLLGLFEF